MNVASETGCKEWFGSSICGKHCTIEKEKGWSVESELMQMYCVLYVFKCLHVFMYIYNPRGS